MPSPFHDPLLAPLYRFPTLPSAHDSITLLTGVLGATPHWLLLRCLHGVFLAPPAADDIDDVAVVFVSFMRDAKFWRENVAKLGLDLEVLEQRGRYAFIDGLTRLFSATGRCPSEPLPEEPIVVRSLGLHHLRNALEVALRRIRTHSRVILIFDQPDALLAVSDPAFLQVGDLHAEIMWAREQVYSTIATLSADTPLLNMQNTPLEKRHAEFITGMMHIADVITSVRRLDTGSANYVSGVMRISVRHRRGDCCRIKVEDEDEPLDNGEFLFHVEGDGNARIFKRGS